MSGVGITPGSKASVPQCRFFVQRKKRLCRMTVKPGRQYCGEHEPQPKTVAGETDKRIPCPNDPKHTCYASKLLKHLAVCNARRTKQPPYIINNINAPEAADTCPRLPLSSYPKDAVANVIDKVNHLYAKHVEGHITIEPPSPIHRAVLPEFSETDRAESSLRHLRQVSALLWCAERAPLPAPRTCFVELGAGKGQLSYYAAHAWCAGTGSRVLAVDRAPLRHKRDNKLRSAPPTLQPTDNAEQSGHDVSDVNRAKAVNANMSTNDRQNLSNINGNLQTHTDDNDQSNDRVGNADANITDERNPPTDNITLNTSRISNKPNEIDRINASNVTNSENNRVDVATDNPKGITENSEVSDEVIKDFNNTSKSDNGDSRPSANKTVSSKVSPSGVRTVSGGGDTETERCVSESGDEVAVRLRADLAHLALEAVPVVAESNAVVGLAKHLCGVATDYALCCIAAPGVVSKTKGLVLATCCHHRVVRAPYVANQQLQELGINAEEFNIMLGIVSWATCGDGRSRERRLEGCSEETEGDGGREETGRREESGRRAKALLDWGRVLWLQGKGFDARLCYYVPREVSLENVAIVALKR